MTSLTVLPALKAEGWVGGGVVQGRGWRDEDLSSRDWLPAGAPAAAQAPQRKAFFSVGWGGNS